MTLAKLVIYCERANDMVRRERSSSSDLFSPNYKPSR